MGLATNTRWLHSIRQDKRADRDKTPSELSHGGARISLTFRQIGTFIDASQSRIWGQGATSKTREGAKEVVNGQTEEAVRLLKAFGAENNRSVFDWAEWYGDGFDVLHMGVPKRVFYSSSSLSGSSSSSEGARACGDVANVCVALALAEMGVGCAKGSVEGMEVRFEDNDPGRAVVEGCGSVLRYLDAVYGTGRRYDQMLPGEVAKRFVRLQRGLDLWGKWKGAVEEAGVKVDGEGRASEEQVGAVKKLLKKELGDWEAWAEEASTAATPSEDKTAAAEKGISVYIAGSQPSPADFAVWPVLHDIVRVCGEEVLGENLRRYYTAFRERSSVAKALGQVKGE
jgi:glutathione S-transferase